MPDYGYTIIFSTSKYDKVTDKESVTTVIDKTSPQIQEINNVLSEQFNKPRYECHLDQMMLFSITFRNCNTGIRYMGLYVISLAEITHPLFITNVQLQKVLDADYIIRSNDIYYSYPSFRFNKFHNGCHFHLDESNKIVINNQKTNSHGLVR